MQKLSVIKRVRRRVLPVVMVLCVLLMATNGLIPFASGAAGEDYTYTGDRLSVAEVDAMAANCTYKIVSKNYTTTPVPFPTIAETLSPSYSPSEINGTAVTFATNGKYKWDTDGRPSQHLELWCLQKPSGDYDVMVTFTLPYAVRELKLTGVEKDPELAASGRAFFQGFWVSSDGEDYTRFDTEIRSEYAECYTWDGDKHSEETKTRLGFTLYGTREEAFRYVQVKFSASWIPALTAFYLPEKVTSISVNGEDSVFAYQTAAYTAAVGPENAGYKEVVWSVEDTGTGTTIDPNTGVLTAGAKAGTVTVKATAKDQSGTVGQKTVTIRAIEKPVTAITIDGAATVIRGQTATYTAQVAPADASVRTVIWSVEDNGTGTTIDPNTGVLTAGAKAGTVTVKATAKDGSDVVGSLSVTVREPAKMVESVTVQGSDHVVSGQTAEYTAVVEPEDADNKEVVWSVTAGTGTAVIDERSGMLTGGSPGTVTVKATSTDGSNVSDTKEITIDPIPVGGITVSGAPNVFVGQKAVYTAAVEPETATNPGVKWSVTAGTGRASIDENTGELTAESVGTVTVKATAQDGTATVGEFSVNLVSAESLADLSNRLDPRTYIASSYEGANLVLNGTFQWDGTPILCYDSTLPAGQSSDVTFALPYAVNEVKITGIEQPEGRGARFTKVMVSADGESWTEIPVARDALQKPVITDPNREATWDAETGNSGSTLYGTSDEAFRYLKITYGWSWCPGISYIYIPEPETAPEESYGLTIQGGSTQKTSSEIAGAAFTSQDNEEGIWHFRTEDKAFVPGVATYYSPYAITAYKFNLVDSFDPDLNAGFTFWASKDGETYAQIDPVKLYGDTMYTGSKGQWSAKSDWRAFHIEAYGAFTQEEGIQYLQVRMSGENSEERFPGIVSLEMSAVDYPERESLPSLTKPSENEVELLDTFEGEGFTTIEGGKAAEAFQVGVIEVDEDGRGHMVKAIARATEDPGSDAYLMYTVNGDVVRIDLRGYRALGCTEDIWVFASTDGEVWQEISVYDWLQKSASTGGMAEYSLVSSEIPAGTRYIKVELPYVGSTEDLTLHTVQILYAGTGAQPGGPSDPGTPGGPTDPIDDVKTGVADTLPAAAAVLGLSGAAVVISCRKRRKSAE